MGTPGVAMPKGDVRTFGGVEYEVMWDGTAGSRSLTSDGLGNSSLAAMVEDDDVRVPRTNSLHRHPTTLANARAEWASLWDEST